MQGGVYQICIQGHTDNKPHPHIVVLKFDVECLVVPAFDAAGSDINGRIALAKKLGYEQDQVCVQIDNAVHVKWDRGYTGKLAYWHFERERVLEINEIKRGKKLGEMDDYGQLQIILGLLRLAEKSPERFSKNRIRRLVSERNRLIDKMATDAGGPPD